jgi:hypothetical protein
MKTLFRFVLVAALAIPAVPSAAGQTAKVGAFDRQSIVMAFYASPLWSAALKEKLAERDAAKAAGDQERVEELDKWGQAQQKLAHRQLTGDAPIENILRTMKPMLAAVAAQAQVTTVVPEGHRVNKKVATVDVTGLLLDQLQASTKTRKNVEQLQNFKKASPMKYRLCMFLFRFAG